MKKYTDILMSTIWLVLLVTLVIRMPALRLLQEPSDGFCAADLVLSALFCATGLVSPVLAFVFSKRSLFAISFVNLLLFAAMLALIVVSTASKNTAMLQFSLNFVNLFCFVLGLEGNMIVYCTLYFLLQILLAVLFYILLRTKNKNEL